MSKEAQCAKFRPIFTCSPVVLINKHTAFYPVMLLPHSDIQIKL